MDDNSRGRLTVVGTGIQSISHLTNIGKNCIRSATKVYYLVADPVTEKWTVDNSKSSENLYKFYGEGKSRKDTYLEIVEEILKSLRAGEIVCAAFYGHPGFFAFPSREAVRRARAEGFSAEIHPGISAVDCLISDFNIDPGESGFQCFEATDFIVYDRIFDPCSVLVLLQVGLIGDTTFKADYDSGAGLSLLMDILARSFGKEHTVYLYEASEYFIADPRIVEIPLHELPRSPVTPISTLYVPPAQARSPNMDALKKLGMAR